MRNKIKTALREIYGDFNSSLESLYEEKVVEILINADWNSKRQWATYTQLMLELRKTFNDVLMVQELQFRLIDYQDPKTVCLDILNRLDILTPELTRLHNKIMNFA